jgi:hypothetical protein
MSGPPRKTRTDEAMDRAGGQLARSAKLFGRGLMAAVTGGGDGLLDLLEDEVEKHENEKRGGAPPACPTCKDRGIIVGPSGQRAPCPLCPAGQAAPSAEAPRAEVTPPRCATCRDTGFVGSAGARVPCPALGCGAGARRASGR